MQKGIKGDIVEGTRIRCVYYKGSLCIMTPDESNPNPIVAVGCSKSIANLIEAVYNIQDEDLENYD